MIRFIFISLLFIPGLTLAQDSLLLQEKKINTMPDDSVKAMALLELVEAYNNDPEKLRTGSQKALDLSKKIKFERGIYQAYLFLGNYAYYKGEYDQAVRNYTHSLKYYDRINHLPGKANVCNNIGTVFLAQNNLDQALKYFEQSYQVFHTLNHSEGEGRTLNNIGNVYFNREEYDMALNYYRRSLEIKIRIKDRNGEGLLLNNIGNIYGVKGDYKKALEYFTQALRLKEEADDQYGIALALNNIGSLYTYLRDSTKALQHVRKALGIARKIGSKDLTHEAYNSMAQINFEFGNYKDAYVFYQQAVAIRDSLINEETQKSIKEIEANYLNEKKDADHKAEVERFKLQKEKDRLDRNRKNILIYGLFGVISLVVVLLVVLLRSNRQKQKTNQVLNEQKKLIELKNEELSEKNKNITDSINYARRLQRVILPPDKFWKQKLPQSFIIYKPKDIVAGDFYWIEQVGEQIIFAAADCTGHGVPGAMVSVICHNALNRAATEFNLTQPGKILDKTREIILAEFEKSDEEVKDGMDISLCSINLHTRELQWSGANNPLWMIHNTNFTELKPDKQPIGKFAGAQPFTSHRLKLEPGTDLYIFTDGLQDQFGGARGKKFKASQLREVLLQMQHLDMEAQKDHLEQVFQNWKGNFEQVDDVCVIGIRI